MAKDEKNMPITFLNQLHSSGAGYDLIRYVGLPDLFGSESYAMLYFMGRRLARKFDMESISDIIYAFDQLGWGQLELVKERKKLQIFQLMSDSIVYRLSAPVDTEFQLEAGFLAESLEHINRQTCECQEEIHKKVHLVEFTAMYTE